MKTPLMALSMMVLLSACDAGPPSAPQATTPAPAPVTANKPAHDEAVPAPNAAPAEAPTAPEDAVGDEASVDAAIDGNLGDHVRYRAVIDALQAAVAAGDAATVATLVEYPISVDIDGKKTILEGEKAFVARYNDIMTPDIRQAIVGTKYADLFVNYKGVMFGHGQAWINGICKDGQCKNFDVKLVALQHGPE